MRLRIVATYAALASHEWSHIYVVCLTSGD